MNSSKERDSKDSSGLYSWAIICSKGCIIFFCQEQGASLACFKPKVDLDLLGEEFHKSELKAERPAKMSVDRL